MTPLRWEIIQQENGTSKLLRDGEVLNSVIPNKWLEDEVGKYGFCGKEYQNIRRQLSESGKAKIVL